MAPLPDSATARLFVDYVTGATNGVNHTLQVRYLGTDRTAAAAQARVASWLTGIGAGNLRQGWRVLAVRTALAGEEFTVPQTPVAALSGITGTSGNAFPRFLEARETTFVGRAVNSPRRVRLSLFGFTAAISTFDTYRYNVPGAVTALNTAWSNLTAGSSPLVAIDGNAIVWYSYINQNFNSYWERRLRLS